MTEVISKASKVKAAAKKLALATTSEKNEALTAIADALNESRLEILKANAEDVKNAREKGVRESLVDRLKLTDKRIDSMINACHEVSKLKDPVGEVINSWVEKELRVAQIRVPLGAIGMIYESRPNVTLDATILALKAGNSVLLRGGSDAIRSNLAIAKAIKGGLSNSSLPETSVEIIEDTDRKNVQEMLNLDNYLSLIIPRGGAGLIKFVVENSSVPVLETGVGNCHIFVDETANIEKSIEIIDNAKTQRPGTCNAVETVLVHKNIAQKLLPALARRLNSKGVEIRGCETTRKFIDAKAASEEDWATEYLDLILAIKVVNSLDEAIYHIQKYSTGHSEAILTENYSNARAFTTTIDAAAVYVNASTRFTDGEQFGFGGEIGISTQKLHARGPVGLRELTTYKYIVLGNYKVRD
ncbi:gamma-glutamyl phosphate reductase [Kosmotoga arenicorallina S304]|uniref:Gamma-glutamyl phosphate reductase n=1 Tax=Kosmotoga arenicorallina S304 TaxID=1453497 RepID=A0A182C7H0_9BACT|nr:glutamate-5-semialdehyde dehydrogenase [Kosmotoga arenicorallina]OAA31559.1 gamma-glutamyl phosphate reductase [Kosmotoga arenicorallina S304]